MIDAETRLGEGCHVSQEKSAERSLHIRSAAEKHNTHKHRLNTLTSIITVVAIFSADKNGFKSVISIFCCSVSVENISLHFQTFIWPLIVIIQ